MFRELLSIFRSTSPLAAMSQNFARMLNLTHEMTLTAGDVFFGGQCTPDDRELIYERDVKVNQLQRTIRKQVIAHLSIQGNTPDVPYCLLLMSLVKDVERLGDYAKNLLELIDLRPEKLPDDKISEELRSIRQGITEGFKAAGKVFVSLEKDRALRLIRDGREIAHRSDALIERIAGARYEPVTTTALVLGARYYKRIGGHLLNVISSVVMPLHKVDYFDEDEINRRHESVLKPMSSSGEKE